MSRSFILGGAKYCYYFLPLAVLLWATQPMVSQQDASGLQHFSNYLTVGFAPDSIVQYDGNAPNPLDTTSGPYGDGIIIENHPDYVMFLPGETVNGLKNFTFSFYVKLNGFNFHNNIISLAREGSSNELIIAYNFTKFDKGILLSLIHI